jgi:hypothetical protein
MAETFEPATRRISRCHRVGQNEAPISPDLVERGFQCGASIIEWPVEQRMAVVVHEQVEDNDLRRVLPREQLNARGGGMEAKLKRIEWLVRDN